MTIFSILASRGSTVYSLSNLVNFTFFWRTIVTKKYVVAVRVIPICTQKSVKVHMYIRVPN
jgi:hypothetical protein